MDWNFRPLELNETRILFMRHGAHKNNILTPEAVAMCLATGKALSDGYKIDSVLSSPSPRAIETALLILQGSGMMWSYIRTDDRLADMAINPESTTAVRDAKVIIELAGVPMNDPALAQVLFDSRFVDLMTRRGEEGTDCLREIALTNPGKTILATSHGVARIENTLMVLRGEELHQPERLVATCQIVELILNSGTGELVEENWLEPVVMG